MTAARPESATRASDIWARIAAPLPKDAIQWRVDGRPLERDGKHFARFVAYVDAQFVRERLDLVVPGEWDLHLELLPALAANGDGEALDEPCAFKAKLQILGVEREDVGMGKDYKSAASDAFKRVAVRFGVASELYAYQPNYVQVEIRGKSVKPVEDPGYAYERRYGRERGVTAAAAQLNETRTTSLPPADSAPADSAPSKPQHQEGGPSCPKCGGRMWDNRLTKTNPKAPDFKCQNRQCEGVIWPAKEGRDAAGARVAQAAEPPAAAPSGASAQEESDELPF